MRSFKDTNDKSIYTSKLLKRSAWEKQCKATQKEDRRQCTTMSGGTWCWLVCPFSRPRLAPAPSAAPPGGTEVHPTTFFWVFLFFFFFPHLYRWCSCFKISLEQNMKGVVIPIVSSSLPGKLLPHAQHTYAHTCRCTHMVVFGHLRMAVQVEGPCLAGARRPN